MVHLVIHKVWSMVFRYSREFILFLLFRRMFTRSMEIVALARTFPELGVRTALPSFYGGFIKFKHHQHLQVSTECSCSYGSANKSSIVVSESKCVGASLYDEFVEHAIREFGYHTTLLPYPLEEGLEEVVADGGKTILYNYAYKSSKIRLFRIANLDGGESMQVFNMAIFPSPEYDLPIFCADFFSTSTNHLIVLDLNPLFNAEKNKMYKEKYYTGLLPVLNKHTEVVPWGQKLTTESLQFFSPLVIWTKLESRQDVREKIFPAFKDYLLEWLKIMEKAEVALDPEEISKNQEAQHRYLLWRSTKDPGRPLLHKLFGEDWCETYINNFLFNGVTYLGKKNFLDYFPEYRCEDGSINRKRSIIGKSCEFRPWDKEGNFILGSLDM